MTNATSATPVTEILTSRICENKFGNLELKCTKCTETDAKDGYILTLKHESAREMPTPFGLKIQPVKHTFYMKVSESVEIGFTAEMNMDMFSITERQFTFADEDSVAHDVWCKWLHIPTTITA